MVVGEKEEGSVNGEEEEVDLKEGKEEINDESPNTKTKTARSSKSGRGKERKPSSKSSIVSESSAYSSSNNNSNNNNHGATVVEASPRSTLDYESRRSSTSSYYSDHYYYYSPLSSAPANCNQDLPGYCNSPTSSVESYSSNSNSNRSLSSKAKSWLSFNSTSCEAPMSRAPSRNLLRNFFSSSSSSGPLSLRQQHSMWLDFISSKKKGGGGKGEKGRSSTPPSIINAAEQQNGNNSIGMGMGSKLRRCSSDRNRLAMLDPTCSALDQLFPLKTSRSSRFSRQLDIDPSLLFETRATQLDQDKARTSNFGDPLALPLLARNVAPSATSSTPSVPKKVPTEEVDGYSNNGYHSCNESGKNVPFLRKNPSKASSYCSSESSVPTPKISRVLLNMAEAHEEQHLKSLWHKRGSSCLPKCASVILSRSKHSEHHARFPFGDD